MTLLPGDPDGYDERAVDRRGHDEPDDEHDGGGRDPADRAGATTGVDDLLAATAAPAGARHRPPARADRVATGRPAGRRRARPGVLVLALLIVTVIGAGVLVGGGLLVRHLFGPTSSDTAADYAGPGTGAVVVQVHSGDGAGTIAASLEQAGVVRSPGAFTSAAAQDPRSRTIQPGYYRLHLKMQASLALGLLLSPQGIAPRTRVTLPEGLTEAQTLARLAAGTRVPLASLQQAAADPSALGLPPYAGGHLEGFLRPGQYDVAPDATAAQALGQLTAAFTAAAPALDLQAKAAALGITPLQAVTVASLIEHEAAQSSDRPKVARVVYNRLEAGTPLGLESTVRYALGGAGQTRLTASQLAAAAASPLRAYDTYVHTGLPPGPIDSPGTAALQAALSPARGSWLYFVTLPKTNTTEFVDTAAQFAQLTAQCQAQGGC